MKPRWLTWLVVVAIGLLAAGAVAIILLHRQAERQETVAALKNCISRVALTAMGEGLYPLLGHKDREVTFPKGDIRDLYRWMTTSRYIMKYEWQQGPPPGITDFEVGTFRDIWGHELVYRFPPRRKDILFELYSIGPNGIDEGGDGDDVTSFATVAFANPAVAGAFKDGIVDPEWFWENLDRLKRDTERPLIIAAPPERFRRHNAAEPD